METQITQDIETLGGCEGDLATIMMPEFFGHIYKFIVILSYIAFPIFYLLINGFILAIIIKDPSSSSQMNKI